MYFVSELFECWCHHHTILFIRWPLSCIHISYTLILVDSRLGYGSSEVKLSFFGSPHFIHIPSDPIWTHEIIYWLLSSSLSLQSFQPLDYSHTDEDSQLDLRFSSFNFRCVPFFSLFLLHLLGIVKRDTYNNRTWVVYTKIV